MRSAPLLLMGLITIAGCQGGGNSSLGKATDAAVAPFAVLDLAARTYVYRASVPDLATNPAYRSSSIVFRRVAVGGGDALVGVFELTQAQWQLLDPGTPPWNGLAASLLPAAADDQPACNLDYDSVAAAVTGFVLAGGARLDLPSAAEWTAACGVASGWSFGANATQAQLQAVAVVAETAGGLAGPRPVGTRAVNPRGFYDLHGNVWEWNKPGDRVRGGSWHDGYWSSRTEIAVDAASGSATSTLDSGIPHALIGARLVLHP